MNTADVHLRYEKDRRADLILAARRQARAARVTAAGEAERRRLPASHRRRPFLSLLHLSWTRPAPHS